MDFDKLEDEIEGLQDQLSETPVGSEDYKELIQEIDKLTRLRFDLYEQSSKIDLENRKQDLEEVKTKSQLAIEQSKVEAQDKDSKRGFWKTIVQGSLLLVATGMTIFAEETRPIVSKGVNFGKNVISKF